MDSYKIETIEDPHNEECEMCQNDKATHVFIGKVDEYDFFVKVCGFCLVSLKNHAEKKKAIRIPSDDEMDNGLDYDFLEDECEACMGKSTNFIKQDEHYFNLCDECYADFF